VGENYVHASQLIAFDNIRGAQESLFVGFFNTGERARWSLAWLGMVKVPWGVVIERLAPTELTVPPVMTQCNHRDRNRRDTQ
jgi:hypothetical protein